MKKWLLDVEKCMIVDEKFQKTYLDNNLDPEDYQNTIRHFVECYLDDEDEGRYIADFYQMAGVLRTADDEGMLLYIDMNYIYELWKGYCHDDMH